MAGTATDDNKVRAVTVRITDDEDRQLDEEAKRTGLSRSDLIRLSWRVYLKSSARKAVA